MCNKDDDDDVSWAFLGSNFSKMSLLFKSQILLSMTIDWSCYRLQQERLEAARVAEEMARKAAEEAVRQLEVEHSAKIVIETLPESNEQ